MKENYVISNDGPLICLPGKSMPFLQKANRKQFEVVARPLSSVQAGQNPNNCGGWQIIQNARRNSSKVKSCALHILSLNNLAF